MASAEMTGGGDEPVERAQIPTNRMLDAIEVTRSA